MAQFYSGVNRRLYWRARVLAADDFAALLGQAGPLADLLEQGWSWGSYPVLSKWNETPYRQRRIDRLRAQEIAQMQAKAAGQPWPYPQQPPPPGRRTTTAGPAPAQQRQTQPQQRARSAPRARRVPALAPPAGRVPLPLAVWIALVCLGLLVGSGWGLYANQVQQTQAALLHGEARATSVVEQVTNQAQAAAQWTATRAVEEQANQTAQAQAAKTAQVIRATQAAQDANPYPPHQGTLLLQDYMNTAALEGWKEVQDSSLGATCQYSGGGYQVSMTQTNNAYPCMAENTSLGNFVYEIQMRVLLGDCGVLLFRGNHDAQATFWSHFYYFKVCANGTFELQKYDFCVNHWPLPPCGTVTTDNNGVDLLATQPSSAIHQGNQVNTVAVVAQGSTFTFYVNRQQVASAQDGLFSAGAIGVAAEDDTSQTTVVYTNLRIWTL